MHDVHTCIPFDVLVSLSSSLGSGFSIERANVLLFTGASTSEVESNNDLKLKQQELIHQQQLYAFSKQLQHICPDLNHVLWGY